MFLMRNNRLSLPLPLQMMEDFSGLALPPLFGGHILEAELEPGGVELGPGEVNITVIHIYVSKCNYLGSTTCVIKLLNEM